MTIQELFIINLKDYRRLRKFSQSRLAEHCGSSQTYIAEIEVGKKFPSPAMIEQIASALNIESHCLFKDEPIKTGTAARNLSPSQRKEIAEKVYAATVKIIDQY
jgi:transcriptional regulator with XRE-family HTH domain